MTLVGYGYNAANQTGNGQKRKGAITFYAWTDQRTYFSAPREFMEYDAGPTNQQGCQGDSGGPVFYRYLGVDYLISTVSHGPRGCTNSLMVTTEMSRKRFWILAKGQELTGVFGDLTADGSLTSADIDMLSSDYRGLAHPRSDLDNDGFVTMADADVLILNAFRTYMGDATLDGKVDTADWVVIRKGMGTGGAGWSGGDMNFDGVVTQVDMDIYRANYGRVGARATAL
jgi:hypothetical protein